MRWTANRYNTLLKNGACSPLYLIFISWVLLFTFTSVGFTDELSLVTQVEFQPLASATQRLVEALDYLGSPLSEGDLSAINTALISDDHQQAIAGIQKVLDPYCLVGVNINPESRVKVKEGPVNKELMQQGWRTFLVKVHNEAGVTAPLAAESENAAPLYKRSTGSPDPQVTVPKSDIPHRFLDIDVYANPPLKASLSGLELEYRIVQLYSRDAGKREAMLGFNIGQGTQDIGFRSQVPILFHCVPAVDVTLEVLDFDGKPTTAAFIIRDEFNRVYPSRGRRLAPDFFFHNQIYRHNGESVLLPPGNYTVEYTRGPEYQGKDPNHYRSECRDASRNISSGKMDSYRCRRLAFWRSSCPRSGLLPL